MSVITSVRRGPERSLTTCCSNAAISGAFRSNYVPLATQSVIPGMTWAEFDALDGTGYNYDCVASYGIWIERDRTPDYAGGDAPLLWLRENGWESRADCIPAPLESPQRKVLTLVVTMNGNPLAGAAVVGYFRYIADYVDGEYQEPEEANFEADFTDTTITDENGIAQFTLVGSVPIYNTAQYRVLVDPFDDGSWSLWTAGGVGNTDDRKDFIILSGD